MKPFRRRKDRTSDATVVKLEATSAFKQFFETQFQPLEVQRIATPRIVEDSEEKYSSESSSSDWEGLSSVSEPASSVEVVEHVELPDSRTAVLQDFKVCQVKKCPCFTLHILKGVATQASAINDVLPDTQTEEQETMNLKNDRALQRLLKESHLLNSHKDTILQGANRHHAVDMRLKDLGAKGSILEHEKMPLAHRKGIRAKNRARGDIRRKEAQKNGIILEKSPVSRRPSVKRRVREIGAPGVGRLSGATLKLSQKDLQTLQSPKMVKASSARAHR